MIGKLKEERNGHDADTRRIQTGHVGDDVTEVWKHRPHAGAIAVPPPEHAGGESGEAYH
jgi:hypothetical protein